MGTQNKALLSLGNVKAFRGHAVNNFVVNVTSDEFVKHLDSSYGDAIVCNIGFAPGGLLKQASPLMFQRLKEDYTEEVQTSLMSQLVQGNDVDIEFHA